MIFQPGESIGRTGYGLYIDWENEQTRKTSIIFDIPEMVGRLLYQIICLICLKSALHKLKVKKYRT